MQHTGNEDNVPDDMSPNTGAEEDLTPTFWHSTYNIPCFEVTTADVQHILTPATCSICPLYCVQTANSKAVCRCRCHYQSASPQGDRLETDQRPARIGTKTADFHDVLRGPPGGMFEIFALHRVSFLRLSFHRCGYGIISGWRIHKCGRPYDLYVKKTLLQLCRILASG